MSGIEVAGLVLGAIPLILSALDGYQKLGRKRDAFTRRSFHVDRMKHVLGRQYRLIQSDVRLILRRCDLEAVLDDEEISTSGLSTLRRPEVQDAVRLFLNHHYDDYMDVIKECEVILLDIFRSIENVAEDSWIVQASLAATLRMNTKLGGNRPDFWKKVKFTMRKDDMDAAIASLDKAVQNLDVLRSRSQQLNETEIMSTTQSSHRLVKALYSVRRKASMLYQALLRSWNWTTKCHDSHAVRLFLENGPLVSRPAHLSSKRRQKFSLALEGHKSSCTDTYHICGVEVMESDATASNIKFHIPQTPTNLAPFVDDICDIFVQSGSKTDQICLYLDEDGKLRYDNQSVSPTVVAAIGTPKTQLVGLQDVLALPDLSLRGRVKVAALIALAVIQLHSTPWCDCLQKEAFFVLKDDHGIIDSDRPCVVCHFEPNTRQTANKQKHNAELELLNLGIMILELWHNTAVETFAASAQIPLEPDYYSRLRVAKKWIEVSQNNMLPDIDSAAKRCVGCRFDVADADLDDMKFISGVYEGVVKPLSAMAFGQSQP